MTFDQFTALVTGARLTGAQTTCPEMPSTSPRFKINSPTQPSLKITVQSAKCSKLKQKHVNGLIILFFGLEKVIYVVSDAKVTAIRLRKNWITKKKENCRLFNIKKLFCQYLFCKLIFLAHAFFRFLP